MVTSQRSARSVSICKICTGYAESQCCSATRRASWTAFTARVRCRPAVHRALRSFRGGGCTAGNQAPTPVDVFSGVLIRQPTTDSVEILKTMLFQGMPISSRWRDRRIQSDCESSSFLAQAPFPLESEVFNSIGHKQPVEVANQI